MINTLAGLAGAAGSAGCAAVASVFVSSAFFSSLALLQEPRKSSVLKAMAVVAKNWNVSF
jgi:hypothetical protein